MIDRQLSSKRRKTQTVDRERLMQAPGQMQMDRWTQPGASTNRDLEQTHWPKGTEQVAEAERHMGGRWQQGRESQIQAEEQTDLRTAVGQVQRETQPGHHKLTSDR